MSAFLWGSQTQPRSKTPRPLTVVHNAVVGRLGLKCPRQATGHKLKMRWTTPIDSVDCIQRQRQKSVSQKTKQSKGFKKKTDKDTNIKQTANK